jgi:hypothetical protein
MLIAELNQAYCYYRLYESGTRSTNELSKRKPRSFEDYLKIDSEINNLIHNYNEEKKEENTVLSNKIISHNYPNPFNPETTISFTISKFNNRVKNNVVIDIYNIKGQRVRTLVNDNLQDGNHKVVWNGKDENDKSVGSGIYFYQIKNNDHVVATNKMLLLK